MGFLYHALRVLVVVMQSKDNVLAPFIFCIQTALLIVLIGMSFRLLKAISDKDRNIYVTGVSYLWILALVIYNGLFLLQQIKDHLAGVSIVTAESVVEIAAMITAKAILFCVSYYFVIKRKSIIILLLILFIVPMPFLNNALLLSTKIAWLGFYIYLCISTYRLYTVNRQAESKSVVIPA